MPLLEEKLGQVLQPLFFVVPQEIRANNEIINKR
tara:strand:+ start:15866 stop:15967 length:102 start_codon:yes stop_codon:yes gene_type:complete